MYELIGEIDGKHSSAHTRHSNIIAALGERLHEAEDKVELLEKLTGLQQATLGTLERRKVEVNDLRFTWQMWLATALFVGAMVGGQKWAASGLSTSIDKQASELSQFKSEMNQRLDTISQHQKDIEKLQDERAAHTTDDLKRISGQVEMANTRISNVQNNLPSRR